MTSEGRSWFVSKNNDIVAFGKRQEKSLFRMKTEVVDGYSYEATHNSSLNIWNQRFCQQGKDHVQRVLNEVSPNNSSFTRHVFLRSNAGKRADRIGELIHSDLCGLMEQIHVIV